jgi:mannonate dehydratase
MAMIHLDLNITNFGIQEYSEMNEATREIFQGANEMKDGYLYANDRPGWGIEIDEKAAARHPFRDNALNGGWGEVRLPDGQIIKQ